MTNRIFVTYNPNVAVEQNTALRLQTIANLYGIAVDLPSRILGSTVINDETVRRISKSNFVLALSLYNMGQEVSHELGAAITKKKPIIALYQHGVGKNIDFQNYVNVSEIYLDLNNTDTTLHEIAVFIDTQFKQNKKETNTTVLGVLGIALGMLALWGLSKEK